MHAKDMADVTARRFMPPSWLPESGTHPFRGERRLFGKGNALFRLGGRRHAPGNPADEPPAPCLVR